MDKKQRRWLEEGLGWACIIHVHNVIVTAEKSEKKADIPSFPPPQSLIRRLDLNFHSWQRMQRSCCPNSYGSGAPL